MIKKKSLDFYCKNSAQGTRHTRNKTSSAMPGHLDNTLKVTVARRNCVSGAHDVFQMASWQRLWDG